MPGDWRPRLHDIPDEKALFKFFEKNARYRGDNGYSIAGIYGDDTDILFKKLKKAWKADVKQHKEEIGESIGLFEKKCSKKDMKKHKSEKKEDINMPKTLEQMIREQLVKEQAKKQAKKELGNVTLMAKDQKSVEGNLSGVDSIKLKKDDEKELKIKKISKKSSSVFADKKMNTEGILMKFVKAMEEERGVSEHPKATARKKKKTEASHVGSSKVKEIYKTAEKLKEAPGVDNPWALAHWQKERKFAGERQHAAEKAARSRKRNK
jgi:hypothetical protein